MEGLTSEEAEKRLNQFGKNQLSSLAKIPSWLVFMAQLKDPFVLLLLAASLISFVIGSIRDGTIILIIVTINACIGYLQEHKAEQIMESLKELVQSPAKVLRNNELVKIPQEDLVLGDIIYLEEGDRIPADVRIIESFNLRTNDFSLTGESMPQEKSNRIMEDYHSLPDRRNMAYLGTTVAAGNARGVVVATGMDTELGKIARLTDSEKNKQSPLQKEMQVIANRITVFASLIGLALFGVTIWQGLGPGFALVYGLGIAVSVVPQALPMQITVALSQGVARLAEKKAVVKKLSAAETLGSTNIICTDKTGTLTKNEMTVRFLWFDGEEYEITGVGYEPKGSIYNEKGEALTYQQIARLKIILDAGTMASNAEIHQPDENHNSWYPIGDPTEAALVTLSMKLGVRSPKEDEETPELHEFSFDSFRKRMSSVRQMEDKVSLCVKGAVDSILPISRYIYRNGELLPLNEQDIEVIKKLNERYSQQAMRVLALAYRDLPDKPEQYILEKVEKDVVFLGLVAMTDPPKEGVREAIERAHQAGISTYIMTGDHAITARAIAEQIHLSPNPEGILVVRGEELEKLGDRELEQTMDNRDAIIFSRVSPEDKLRIVKTLKKQGKVVAVTGDGVNDAPALKSAHIGVAMGGIGTDVSKEAAELVLLDDNYSTLVYAIQEGRTIYNNLKKTILASLVSNGAELTIVLLGLVSMSLMGWPMPILAIQILAIDLLAEIMPLTALTFDPAPKEIMTSPPRSQREHILDKYSGIEVLFLGLVMGGLAFANFIFFAQRSGVELTSQHILYARATTISYTTIAFCQFINILSRRYRYSSFFNRNLTSNPKLLWSIVVSICLILAAIYVPALNKLLSFAPLSLGDWGIIIISATIFLLVYEIIKFFRRIKYNKKERA